MEQLTAENLIIFLLAGFSGLNLFKQGLARAQNAYAKNTVTSSAQVVRTPSRVRVDYHSMG